MMKISWCIALTLLLINCSHVHILQVQSKKELYDIWQLNETNSLENISGFKPNITPRSRFGGTLTYKENATGYFYTAKINNRWWLVYRV